LPTTPYSSTPLIESYFRDSIKQFGFIILTFNADFKSKRWGSPLTIKFALPETAQSINLPSSGSIGSLIFFFDVYYNAIFENK
jgi:hypothetical protein